MIRIRFQYGAEERLGIGMGGQRVDVRCRADLAETTLVENRDAVGESPDDGEVVRHEHIGGAALPLQLIQQVEHRRLNGDVERRSHLVAEHDLGFGGEGSCNGNALLFAAGQLVR